MEEVNNEKLLYKIDKLEQIVKMLQFDFTILHDEEFQYIVEILNKKVRLQKARIKAIELKNTLSTNSK